MSVLIKGMEMPTSCGFCPFKYRTMEGDECMFGVAYTTYQSRPKDCPLILVPPHGRLIDADALLNEGADLCLCEYDHENTWGFSYDMINDAPTIIPASEEGK